MASSASSALSNFSNGGNSHEYVYTFQALSEEDYKLWFEALEGKERKGASGAGPAASTSSGASAGKKSSFKLSGGGSSGGGHSSTDHHHNQHHLNLPLTASPDNTESYELDDEGFFFLRKCIEAIESRGLEQKGIYRVVGVASKVRTLMETFAEKRAVSKRRGSSSAATPKVGGECSAHSASGESGEEEHPPTPSPAAAGEGEGEGKEVAALLPPLFELNLHSEEAFELKTLTSALKSYLRHLSEPIMTFGLHGAFIAAASKSHYFSNFIFTFFFFDYHLYFFIFLNNIFCPFKN